MINKAEVKVTPPTPTEGHESDEGNNPPVAGVACELTSGKGGLDVAHTPLLPRQAQIAKQGQPSQLRRLATAA